MDFKRYYRQEEKKKPSFWQNAKSVAVSSIFLVAIVALFAWSFMFGARLGNSNPGLSELQSRRTLRGCINNEVWAFIDVGKTMGQVFTELDGNYEPMLCRPGNESDGLLMREVCLDGLKRGAQVVQGQWGKETFVMMAKIHENGQWIWRPYQCREGVPIVKTADAATEQ